MKKTLAAMALATGIGLVGSGCSDYTEKDFENVNWLNYNNQSGMIWSCYKKENIPRSGMNWAIYIDQVRKKNNGNLSGNILLPDLDGNGEVGK